MGEGTGLTKFAGILEPILTKFCLFLLFVWGFEPPVWFQRHWSSFLLGLRCDRLCYYYFFGSLLRHSWYKRFHICVKNSWLFEWLLTCKLFFHILKVIFDQGFAFRWALLLLTYGFIRGCICLNFLNDLFSYRILDQFTIIFRVLPVGLN